MDRCSCLSLSISRGVLNRGFCGRHLASEEMRLVSIGMTDCAKHGCERRIQASRAAWTRVRAYLYDDRKVKFLGKLVFLWELNRATIAGRSIEERARHRSGTAPVSGNADSSRSQAGLFLCPASPPPGHLSTGAPRAALGRIRCVDDDGTQWHPHRCALSSGM